jgi:phosphonopyruvate decarboxylase
MMTMMQACGVVAMHRGEDTLVVATMGAMFAFDRIDTEMANGPEDQRRLLAPRLSSVPLMGGAAGLGLGLALAQPQRQVIVVDGDASLLLELGGLVTVAQQQPANLVHVVIRNGTQFTGLGNLHAPAPEFNFAGAARNAGYRSAESIGDAAQWAECLARLLAAPGPHFVELLVEPLPARAGDGFSHAEMPDQQFTRMGQEAQAMHQHLQAAVP